MFLLRVDLRSWHSSVPSAHPDHNPQHKDDQRNDRQEEDDAQDHNTVRHGNSCLRHIFLRDPDGWSQHTSAGQILEQDAVGERRSS